MVAKSKAEKALAKADLNVPGVFMTDLLDYTDVLPLLPKNLFEVTFVMCLPAQARANMLNVKPRDIQATDSVNTLVRLGLAKTVAVRYVGAAIALRKTAADFANDPTCDRLTEAHADLCYNPSGESSLRGNIATAMRSPELLRKYRRGLMLQFVGNIQSACIHSPFSIASNIGSLTPKEFMERLPFKSTANMLPDLISDLNSRLECTPDNPRVFNELIPFPVDKFPLEEGLHITRTTPSLGDFSEDPELTEGLPAWKKAAIKQYQDVRKSIK